MDEPPNKPADEPSEELVEAWTIYNLRVLAEQQARSGRLPPVRSVTPLPRLLTPTPEPRAAEASQGKDRSWTSGEPVTSNDLEGDPAGADNDVEPDSGEQPSRGVATIRAARAARAGSK